VFNYVAIIVISELDEIYYKQINSQLKEEFEHREMEVPIRNISNIDIKQGIHWVDSLMLMMVDVIYLIYDIGYFHFMPYFIFIILGSWK